MPIERVEWTCPGCRRKYAIPASAPTPTLCPNCQQVGEDVAEAQRLDSEWQDRSDVIAQGQRAPVAAQSSAVATRLADRGTGTAAGLPPSPPAPLPRGERGAEVAPGQRGQGTQTLPQQRPPQQRNPQHAPQPRPPQRTSQPAPAQQQDEVAEEAIEENLSPEMAEFPLIVDTPPPRDVSRRESPSTKRKQKPTTLRMIAFCYRLLAGIFALGALAALLYAISKAVTMDVGAERSTAIGAGVASFIASGLAAFGSVSFAEVIQLLLDIDDRTRER